MLDFNFLSLNQYTWQDLTDYGRVMPYGNIDQGSALIDVMACCLMVDAWSWTSTVHLTHKQLEMYGCILSTVATDALVLKHQVISSHSAD